MEAGLAGPSPEDQGPAPSRAGEFLGHPKGLSVLFATEMWERFSYYGMRALLVLYMVRYLFLPGRPDQVWGLASLRAGLEWLSGPLGPQPLASEIYGLYTGLVYLTPIFGGWLADHHLGHRRMVVIGATLMALGHFMMASERFFLPALLLLILGNGAFKPNISSQVGRLYGPGDRRRDRAYSIFYVGINLGAFLAPLVCGTLGERAGWHYGFAAAGVGMVVGLAAYVHGLPSLPPDMAGIGKVAAPRPIDRPIPGQERRAVGRLLALCAISTLFWASYEQQGNTIALWVDDFTDRQVTLPFWQGVIPTTWFQAFNPFMIFAFTPGVVAFWAWQGSRHGEPSDVAKMALGCLGPVLANLIMALAAWQTGDQKASWWWLVAYFVTITVGELYFSPVGLSLVSRLAPAGAVSMMMGIWFVSSFAGGLMAGWLGSLWSAMDKTSFFLMIAALSMSAGIAIATLAVKWPAKRQL